MTTTLLEDAYMPQDQARQFVVDLVTHLADWPIKTAAGFRNAIVGKNSVIAINPLLGIEKEDDVNFLTGILRRTVTEGRMIDFGFLPNELIKRESNRSRDLFESGELLHPYESWIGVTSWEGGMNGYYFSPHPYEPEKTLCVELYGVSMPNVTDAILVYDIVSIEIVGPGNTIFYPANYVVPQSMDDNMARAANSVDPLCTMLRILADASIPVVDHPEPVKLNRARAKRGEAPIPAHTEVLTKDYVALYKAAVVEHIARGGTHASPMAHWRRAHMRHLSSGRVVPVRSTKVNWRDNEELHRLFYRVQS